MNFQGGAIQCRVGRNSEPSLGLCVCVCVIFFVYPHDNNNTYNWLLINSVNMREHTYSCAAYAVNEVFTVCAVSHPNSNRELKETLQDSHPCTHVRVFTGL